MRVHSRDQFQDEHARVKRRIKEWPRRRSSFLDIVQQLMVAEDGDFRVIDAGKGVIALGAQFACARPQDHAIVKDKAYSLCMCVGSIDKGI